MSFNNALRRPSDIPNSVGNPSRALSRLGWAPSYDIDSVIIAMCSEAKKQFRINQV